MPAKKNNFHPRALVLTADGFEDQELNYPVQRMLEEGWKVTIAAPTMNPVTGKHGHTVNPDLTFEQVNPDNYEVLILPGGSAPKAIRNMAAAIDITSSFLSKNKVTAAVCHGPLILASTGMISGRHLTSYLRDNVPEEMKKAGANWEDNEVVVDGNLVTSRNKPDLPAFMREVISAVNKKSGEVQRQMEKIVHE